MSGLQAANSPALQEALCLPPSWGGCSPGNLWHAVKAHKVYEDRVTKLSSFSWSPNLFLLANSFLPSWKHWCILQFPDEAFSIPPLASGITDMSEKPQRLLWNIIRGALIFLLCPHCHSRESTSQVIGILAQSRSSCSLTCSPPCSQSSQLVQCCSPSEEPP
jgi:hypothetical protein